MTFFERFDNECKKKGTTPTALLKSLKISTSKLTAWKNGSMPSSEWVVLISEALGTSIEYLLTGKENTFSTKLHKYHWNHPADDPVSKKYNAVCRTVCMLAGKPKGYALLSAARVPADAPATLTDAQINFLAFMMDGKTHQIVNVSVFDDDKLPEYSRFDILEKYVDFDPTYSSVSELINEFPETKEWFGEVNKLYTEALLEKVEPQCLTEMAEMLSKHSSYEQGKIMEIFKNAIREFEQNITAENKDRVSS